MSESTAAAVIGACAILGAAVLALIGVLLPILLSIRRRAGAAAQHAGAAEQHAAVAADQTANEHGTNLREELDERHAENTRAIADVATAVRSSDRRNGRRWASTNRRIDALAARLDIVEDTMPHPIRRRHP